MTKPHSERGQGRKPEAGRLMQVQIRIQSDEEADIIKALTPRQRAQAMLKTKLTEEVKK